VPHIIVIGGGPAGVMAAIAARELAGAARSAPLCPDVLVLDAGAPLATVLRTGGGRCNLANATFDIRELSANYPRGGRFLLSAFSRFGAAETLEWFRSRGLALSVEESGRVFPSSGKTFDVRNLLATEIRRAGVGMRQQTPVRRIVRLPGGFSVHFGGKVERCQALILATGGNWRDNIGSGYELARSLGHSTTPLAPALCGLVTTEKWPGSLAGLTIRGAKAIARFEGRKMAEEEGDFVFTHRGISGPLAFRISSRCAFVPYSKDSPLTLAISLAYETGNGGNGGLTTEDRLRRALAQRPRQRLSSILRAFFPSSLALLILSMANISQSAIGSQLDRARRARLCRLIDSLPLAVAGREEGGEIVTAGGIRLEEVDPRTLESRISPGLFFCGEILDIDGFTGGFNLQAAWSTGRLAGLGAASRIRYP
jgi:predicted Rossmann fold flavoprotein